MAVIMVLALVSQHCPGISYKLDASPLLHVALPDQPLYTVRYLPEVEARIDQVLNAMPLFQDNECCQCVCSVPVPCPVPLGDEAVLRIQGSRAMPF